MQLLLITWHFIILYSYSLIRVLFEYIFDNPLLSPHALHMLLFCVILKIVLNSSTTIEFCFNDLQPMEWLFIIFDLFMCCRIWCKQLKSLIDMHANHYCQPKSLLVRSLTSVPVVCHPCSRAFTHFCSSWKLQDRISVLNMQILLHVPAQILFHTFSFPIIFRSLCKVCIIWMMTNRLGSKQILVKLSNIKYH
jgi:hypothetical protein